MPKPVDIQKQYKWILETLSTYFYDCTFATYHDPYIDEYVVIVMKEEPNLVAKVLLQGAALDFESSTGSFYCLNDLAPQEQQAALRQYIEGLEEIGF